MRKKFKKEKGILKEFLPYILEKSDHKIYIKPVQSII